MLYIFSRDFFLSFGILTSNSLYSVLLETVSEVFYSVNFVLHLYWIHCIIIHFYFFYSIQKIIIWPILLSTFSDALPNFTCANGIVNFWSTCLSVNALIPFSWVGFIGIFNRVDEVYSRVSSPITFTGNILQLNALKTCSLSLKLKFLFSNPLF